MRRPIIVCCTLFLAFIVFTCSVDAKPAPLQYADADLTVDTTAERTAISPFIYGTNQDIDGSAGFTAFRQGGNRLTGYNWETNASNAGADWQHSSDNYLPWAMGIDESPDLSGVPASVVTVFHDRAQARHAFSLVTLQMAGYAAGDKNGTVTEAQTAPSSRWRAVVFDKPGGLAYPPDATDEAVYMEELLARLIALYGSASGATGIRGYALDNEPALWPSTHPRIHPAQTGCVELIQKSADLAGIVKAADPSAETFGPVLYGMGAFLNLQNAPDWAAAGAGYSWFIDYYLAKMKASGDAAGRRLLDVLDLHWYSEARGDTRVTENGVSAADCAARVQAPRTLWDPTYIENSWIGEWCQARLPLIPKLRAAIDAYYPGTRLAFTEYNHGGEHHVSGGIAQADTLGIFGKYGVYFASYWQVDENSAYAAAAFRIFRNYDGAYGAFGNTSVRAVTPDPAALTIYAAIEDESDARLHLVVINKKPDTVYNAAIAVTASGARAYTRARIWSFDADGAAITEKAPVTGLTGNRLALSLAPYSVSHVVLEE